MGIISTIRRWWGMLFKNEAEREFKVSPVTSPQMDALINKCVMIYRGHPAWVNEEDNVRTINFAKTICEETARLITLAVSISVSGSPMGEYLQAVSYTHLTLPTILLV